MTELKKHIHDDVSGLDYALAGDYYIPDILPPQERRPIGKLGRMHRHYLREHAPVAFIGLLQNGTLWTYLADINEQAEVRLELIIRQMQEAEGVNEALKREDQMEWVRRMNSIRSWAKYGRQVIKSLSLALKEEFGRGFSEDNLEHARRFYLTYKPPVYYKT